MAGNTVTTPPTGQRPAGVLARFSTIGARAAAAACFVCGVALVVGALLLLVMLQRTLVSNVDDVARTRAQDVAALLTQEQVPGTLALPGRDEAVVQVVDADNRVVATSANLETDRLVAGFPAVTQQPETRTVAGLPVEDERDDDFRVVGLTAETAGGRVTVYAAVSLESAEESIAAVRRILLVGLPVLLLILVVTSRYVVGRALRPVDAMRRDVADMSARDLSQRVREPAVDDELGRLARTMNQMLERLESFTDRQRRFVSDASHELQSPLASSLADLEVALAHPDTAKWQEIAAELVADNERMAKLVQDLLFLARADDAVSVSRRSPVDLDDVVASEVARMRPRTSIALDVSRVSPAELRGDPDQLTRVVRNLLDNAVRHAGSKVTLELHHDAETATLIVADDGPGVPVEARDRIFERFARVEESRSRDTGGAGLGLAIAREIVHGHGGTITLEAGGRGARFVVRLPVTG